MATCMYILRDRKKEGHGHERVKDSKSDMVMSVSRRKREGHNTGGEQQTSRAWYSSRILGFSFISLYTVPMMQHRTPGCTRRIFSSYATDRGECHDTLGKEVAG
jgi:hypothetical protein